MVKDCSSRLDGLVLCWTALEELTELGKFSNLSHYNQRGDRTITGDG